MSKFLFLFLTMLACVQAQVSTNVTISLSATDLFNCDELSACDTEITIFCSSSTTSPSECGKVETIWDDAFPIFPERFTFIYVPNQEQKWRFDLVDKDLNFDDVIGSVTADAGQFVAATAVGSSMPLNIRDRAQLHIHRQA